MGRKELPAFFDDGEGGFNGVEIGAVRRERKQVVALGLENGLNLVFVVKAGVVHRGGRAEWGRRKEGREIIVGLES